MVLLLDFRIDEIAVKRELTDQRINLSERQRWPALQITADEAVLIDAQFKCRGAGILGRRDSELFG